MIERFLVWVGAGVLTVGLATATFAGAALAVAQDGPTSTDSSSEASNPTESEQGSADKPDEAEDVEGEPTEQPDTEESDTEEPDTVESDTDVRREKSDGQESVEADEPATKLRTAPKSPEPTPTEFEPPPVPQPDEPDRAPAVVEPEPTPVVHDSAPPTPPEPETARLSLTVVEHEDPEPARPSLINVIGSIAWSFLDFATHLFEGPATVPPGSTARVGRSSLTIDCGVGYTTTADWYFPTEGESPPTKLIYLQHGGFARAGLYNGTAAELAERNNAIVVAPTITSNYFACDGCALGGDPMHAAVAKLFFDDRAALLASAQAAGFEGAALPQRFVIAGHSQGGQLAANAAGYHAAYAPAERVHDLAGVLLLDTSPVGGAVERGVGRIPSDIPVHVISAAPSVLNIFGGADAVVSRVRPGEFVGVQLVGGVHADGWQTTNPPGEFVVGLFTGFPKPANVEAVQVLAQGWINDWYTPDDPDTGFYGPLGSVIDVPTGAGVAQAHVLPTPSRPLNAFEALLKAMFESTVFLTALQACAVDPDEAFFAQNSTPNTVLSLDGKAVTRQSVGQQCMDG